MTSLVVWVKEIQLEKFECEIKSPNNALFILIKVKFIE